MADLAAFSAKVKASGKKPIALVRHQGKLYVPQSQRAVMTAHGVAVAADGEVDASAIKAATAKFQASGHVVFANKEAGASSPSKVPVAPISAPVEPAAPAAPAVARVEAPKPVVSPVPESSETTAEAWSCSRPACGRLAFKASKADGQLFDELLGRKIPTRCYRLTGTPEGAVKLVYNVVGCLLT